MGGQISNTQEVSCFDPICKKGPANYPPPYPHCCGPFFPCPELQTLRRRRKSSAVNDDQVVPPPELKGPHILPVPFPVQEPYLFPYEPVKDPIRPLAVRDLGPEGIHLKPHYPQHPKLKRQNTIPQTKGELQGVDSPQVRTHSEYLAFTPYTDPILHLA